VEFTADTRAVYTTMPKAIAEKLELKELSKRKFKLADSETIEYQASEYIAVEGSKPSGNQPEKATPPQEQQH